MSAVENSILPYESTRWHGKTTLSNSGGEMFLRPNRVVHRRPAVVHIACPSLSHEHESWSGSDESRCRHPQMHAGTLCACHTPVHSFSSPAARISATCLAWALERYEHVETIGFDYGQRHRVELECRETVRSEIERAVPAMGCKLAPDHLLDLGLLGQLSDTALTGEQGNRSSTKAACPTPSYPGAT